MFVLCIPSMYVYVQEGGWIYKSGTVEWIGGESETDAARENCSSQIVWKDAVGGGGEVGGWPTGRLRLRLCTAALDEEQHLSSGRWMIGRPSSRGWPA